MSVKKGLVNGLVWIEFHEHPVVNYRKQFVNVFDVSSKGYDDFSSDFLKEGSFDHNQYCICLMETALRLEENQHSSFLDYQCSQLKSPHLWVVQFITLLNDNSNHYLIESIRRELNFLIFLLKERMNQHYGLVQASALIFKPAIMQENDERFDIIKVKEEVSTKGTFNAKKFFLLRRRTDYLQEIEDNKKAQFVKGIDKELNLLEKTMEFEEREEEVKKIIFKGTSSQLADLVGQLRQFRNRDGDFFFEGSLSNYARFVCNCFCQADGTPFMESSIRKGLTNFRNNKRPRERDRIDISHIKVDEE